MNNLFLRTCKPNGKSYGGFQWNIEIGGITEAPDWNPEPVCGGGLHGLLHGKGDGSYFDWRRDVLWMVCEALGPIVDIDHKIKTSKAKTLFVGDRKGATDFLIAAGCNPSEVVGAFITCGDGSTVTGGNWSIIIADNYTFVNGGDYSTVTGGNYTIVNCGNCSTVTGGHSSTVTAGYWSTVTGGVHSTLTGGNWSTLKGGDYSIVTGGDYSIITGGNWSTLKGGHWSTVTGGEYSTVTGGDYSTVTGGDRSTVTGGDGSILSLKWFDGKRTRIVTAYVGEDGIEPNVPYKLDDNGKFVRA